MIASLRGILAEVTPPTLLLECNAVGYEVWVPDITFASLPAPGDEVRLFTALIIRQDSQTLYGFLEAQERNVFNILLRISGIGAKSALALLSTLDSAALAQAVENNDIKMLTQAQGIGRKNAERILIELRGSSLLSAMPASSPLLSKALEALVALGYPAGTARTALLTAQKSDMDVAALVKAGLVEITSK